MDHFHHPSVSLVDILSNTSEKISPLKVSIFSLLESTISPEITTFPPDFNVSISFYRYIIFWIN